MFFSRRFGASFRGEVFCGNISRLLSCSRIAWEDNERGFMGFLVVDVCCGWFLLFPLWKRPAACKWDFSWCNIFCAAMPGYFHFNSALKASTRSRRIVSFSVFSSPEDVRWNFGALASYLSKLAYLDRLNLWEVSGERSRHYPTKGKWIKKRR